MGAFGTLVERLIGAQVFFIPDGTELISTENASKTEKPADGDWADFDLGRVNMAAYKPETVDSVREYGAAGGGYKKQTRKVVVEDAIEVTVIDYAPKLFDQLMFGLAAVPVSGTPQQAFANANRHKDGWVRLKRINEDGTTLSLAELHVRLSIATNPDDKNEPGSPVWRIAHLADAGALDTVNMTYPA